MKESVSNFFLPFLLCRKPSGGAPSRSAPPSVRQQHIRPYCDQSKGCRSSEIAFSMAGPSESSLDNTESSTGRPDELLGVVLQSPESCRRPNAKCRSSGHVGPDSTATPLSHPSALLLTGRAGYMAFKGSPVAFGSTLGPTTKYPPVLRSI